MRAHGPRNFALQQYAHSWPKCTTSETGMSMQYPSEGLIWPRGKRISNIHPVYIHSTVTVVTIIPFSVITGPAVTLYGQARVRAKSDCGLTVIQQVDWG